MTKTRKEETNSVKKARLEARITPTQKELVVKAASIQGLSLTDFIVSTVTKQASIIVEQNTLMELSKKDSELFVSQILTPSQPSEKLKQAAQEYKQLTKQK